MSIGALPGTAWAVAFVIAPVATGGTVLDEDRAACSGYASGTQQPGIGAGPVLGRRLGVVAPAFAAFLLVGSSTLIYGAASAALGLGHSLALPTVQAHAVNVSEDEVLPRLLLVGRLPFQAANLGTPLIAGWVIAGEGPG